MPGPIPDLAALRRFSPSVVALLLANSIPVIGVVLWNWSILELFLVFWAENVIIGIINVIKMMTLASLARKPAALGAALFFIVHYGLFTFVHGIFIFALFGDGTHFNMGSFSNPDMLFLAGLFLPGHFLCLPAISLFASHFFSYIFNFIGRQEYKATDPAKLLFAPYGRIIVLHLAVLFGGAIIQFFGAPLIALLLLIILKIAFDLSAHVNEHAALQKKDF